MLCQARVIWLGIEWHCDKSKMRRKNEHSVVWNRVQTDLNRKQAVDRKIVEAQIAQDHHFASMKLQKGVCSKAC